MLFKKFFLVFSLILFTELTFAVTTVTVPVFTKATYGQYEKAQATFTISFNGGNYSNPYDSSIATVNAIITLPNATTQTIPCFYYIPATIVGATITELPAQAKWMLRYAPIMTGAYTVIIRVIDANGTLNSAGAAFNTIASTRKGFVRIHPSRTQFMRFDNGTPYYPIGFNLGWNDGSPATFYNNYLTQMGTNKCTWMRYWLCDFARQGLEWTNNAGYWSGFFYGLGRYTQGAAAILDTAVNLCEAQGIYMQLVMQHHGQVSTGADAEWNGGGGNPGSPYNSLNGGPVPQASAGQWFTNAAAKAYHKKQYRYIVARWGYSSNILSWELFNEVEYTDGTDANIDAWHDEMSLYLKQRDINKHLVMTSTGQDNSSMPLLDNNASLDHLQYHIYAGAPIEKATFDQSQTLAAATAKPLWCGEFGLSGAYPAVAAADNWGDHVRKTMWMGMFSEVPAMFWYWDTYINSENLYNIFRPMGTFLTGVDIVGETGGVYKNFKFATNPVITGAVTVAPGNTNFTATNAPDPWTTTIDNQGNVPGTANLNTFIQGAFQGGRNRDVRFNVTFQAGGSVTVNFGSAATPNSIQVFVDGILNATWVVPVGGGSFTVVGITAGPHLIRFYNNANDWAAVNNYNFNNVQLNQLKSYGYVGSTKAYGYVYDHSLPEWADPVSVTAVTTAQIKIGSLTPGSYNVDFFDPQAGAAFIAGGTYTTVNDSITVPIPSFKKDIAFKVYSNPLPVEMGDFDGKIIDKKTYLNWNTYSEKNNDYFEIQRSSNGYDFETAGYVDGAGNSNSLLNYQFTDETPGASVNYYRLKQVDIDEKFYFSKIISLLNQSEPASLYPNPSEEDLFIRMGASESIGATIKIINNLGQEVSSRAVSLTKGNNKIHVNTSTLPSSLYFVHISYDEGLENSVLKFVKR